MKNNKQKPNTYTQEELSTIIKANALCSPAQLKKVLKDYYGISYSQVKRVYKKYVQPLLSGVPQAVEPRIRVKNNVIDKTIEAAVTVEKAVELDDVIKICKIDLNKYSVKSFSVDERANGTFLWTLRCQANKQEQEADLLKKVAEDIKSELISYSPKPKKITFNPTKEGRLLEISIFDAHLGKLGYAPEVGSNYDIKLAKDAFFNALNELIYKAKLQGSISRILFPIGNDYLTIDSNSAETSAGTRQDTDSRFSKIYKEGREMLVEAIETLRQIAPVDVIVVPGNHELSSMLHLGDALECWFHNYDDVKVYNDPISRKYYQFSKVMLCFCHGHIEKPNQLPHLAATEQPSMWASTTYKEWHLGHRHRESVQSFYGVKVRVLDSISGPDKFHHENGYIGSQRIAQAFLFHPENGLECIFQSTSVSPSL